MHGERAAPRHLNNIQTSNCVRPACLHYNPRRPHTSYPTLIYPLISTCMSGEKRPYRESTLSLGLVRVLNALAHDLFPCCLHVVHELYVCAGHSMPQNAASSFLTMRFAEVYPRDPRNLSKLMSRIKRPVPQIPKGGTIKSCRQRGVQRVCVVRSGTTMTHFS